ncbi:cyclic nucleotide-binding/CBS domain-containing protein [Phycicoccus endophyticus]|uniref:Cyclic nucleotide-binding/CBS domain-containing protein n=1 Tax=Phycicoccus endophyticus TaxID=1690220 RepID=A0A7G9R0F9_9MICO|nr:putative nucleotidyltransferase substrate binding domain-containing protein [Phycicoccus endophyticus]NHI20100.1 cyclic nucleotide-binding/CBS domain-containing protein [Phycicoccus endophyticus]QNN49084.1 cyclic nucleotide-binding/CBS domain-containing protein [Phycicoccus endophyticus]GGL38464.1 histidine kinase [Phycicoccus endophyticus]
MALEVELAEVRDFLAQHEPFAGLPAPVLEDLPARMSMRYVRRGAPVIARGEDNHHLVLLRSGAADVHDAQGTLVDRGEAGTSFGSITLTQGNPSTFAVTAIEDCLLLLLPAEDFHALCRAHPDFAAFFDAQRRHRMQGAVAALQLSASGTAILKTTVRELVAREPVSVPSATSIREAARVMAEQRVSSVLVMERGRVAGILTDRDLRTRVVAGGVDASAPVAQVMTADPVTTSVESLAFEALLTMTSRHIHHLPLVDAEGRAAGVVTTTDLLRLEEANPVYLAGDIVKQPDVEGVARSASRLPRVVQGLVEQDASADDIGRVATAVGDAVERRVIALAEAELGPPPVPYCWVALGSRARLEQALASDQDTALLVDDALDEDGQAWFEALAERVTEGLVRCGYPRCRGEVMATNPRWRKPVAAWEREFSSWLSAPTPEAVLHSSIFFDMRAVHGQEELLVRLRRHVLRATPGAQTFLAHLARHAGAHEPPLGFFRGFVLEKAGEHRDTLDIKRGGILPVVELARVHALAVGSAAVNTRARLAAAAEGGALSAELAEDLRDAFEFIGYVRLRHQSEQVRAGQVSDNFVAPDSLSSFEKRHLREAFAIVRFAQQALGRRYLTQFVS